MICIYVHPRHLTNFTIYLSIFHYYQQVELVCDSKIQRNTQLPSGKIADFMKLGSGYQHPHLVTQKTEENMHRTKTPGGWLKFDT